MDSDIYKTIEHSAETIYKERNSKFLALSYHVVAAEDARNIVEGLRKKYYDATHHCYAYRLGANGTEFRMNDDGEPSGTAGRPILGQLLSGEITDCLIVVVRWFGGTKLGVPGLIEAYRSAASDVLEASGTKEMTVNAVYSIRFPFEAMNDIMKTVKTIEPQILEQSFDNMCSMRLSVRLSKAEELKNRLLKISTVELEDETEI